jgi:thiosulfate/3-mercaptopyruvate sulfurtransferase
MADYAHPEMLVDTAWVEAHRSDPGTRIAEVDVDTSAYEQGHVPGAIAWNWTTQLCDTVRRDVIPKNQFEQLMAESGVGNDTTVILYGDNNNWFAAWALWQMKLYGHKDVRLMDGGRKKWVAEGRELTTDAPRVARASYAASGPDLSLRTFLAEAMDASAKIAARHSSTCAARTSSQARSWRRPGCPRPASAAATSPGPPTFRGGRRATRMARSSPTTS